MLARCFVSTCLSDRLPAKSWSNQSPDRSGGSPSARSLAGEPASHQPAASRAALAFAPCRWRAAGDRGVAVDSAGSMERFNASRNLSTAGRVVRSLPPVRRTSRRTVVPSSIFTPRRAWRNTVALFTPYSAPAVLREMPPPASTSERRRDTDVVEADIGFCTPTREFAMKCSVRVGSGRLEVSQCDRGLWYTTCIDRTETRIPGARDLPTSPEAPESRPVDLKPQGRGGPHRPRSLTRGGACK